MKILIITLEYPPQIGGIASYAYNLAAHLPAKETFVYAPKVPGGSEWDKKNSWKTYRHKPYFAFFWPRWLRMYWQIKKIVKREGIERLLIQHALPSGYVGYLIKKFIKVPYLVFLHGTDLKMGLKNKARQLKIVCKNADKVVVGSEFLKHKLTSRFEDLNNVVVVHPCPGDIFLSPISDQEKEMMRAQLALGGKKVVLTVARLADGKGFPHFIRLLPKILIKVPNLVWLVVGDGPKKNQIIDLVQKNNLQNVVRFLGQVNYDELPKFYHLTDIFVLLTHKDETAEEGWGTVFMEAAACGVPVVAGNVGGVEEAVENLVTGLLVDTYQDTQVVAAVSDLLREKDFAKKMGEAGRQRVLNEFTWAKQLALLFS
ncbi:MAG: glycosyltransferase family 4 protein [Patescibacteria group bacterium]|nr:glycosyltransferase family 4 protein [Patescibacteria group bacterium]